MKYNLGINMNKIDNAYNITTRLLKMMFNKLFISSTINATLLMSNSFSGLFTSQSYIPYGSMPQQFFTGLVI